MTRGALDVDPDDPERVALAGDRVPWVEVGYIAPWIVIPLLAYLGRRWTVRRTLRLVGDDSTAFAMVGAIAPRSPFRGRRPVLHLYALEPARAPRRCARGGRRRRWRPGGGAGVPGSKVKGVRGGSAVWARARAAAGVARVASCGRPAGPPRTVPWPRPDRVVDVVPPTPVDPPAPAAAAGGRRSWCAGGARPRRS